ncbi:MAG: hypothetical protein IPJ07_16140 [Acidobacteria bacterium]|nr:hypothetical protein [Acidobacteriota bacterium]
MGIKQEKEGGKRYIIQKEPAKTVKKIIATNDRPFKNKGKLPKKILVIPIAEHNFEKTRENRFCTVALKIPKDLENRQASGV